MALLLYPQFVLAFWAPLVVLGLWRMTARWHRRFTAHTRFWLAWGVAMFPLLSLFVPYLPNLPLREVLPYRVPVAWGVLNSPDVTQVSLLVTFAAHLPFLLIVLGLLGALARGVLEELAALLHVSRIPSRIEETGVGRVRVLHTPGEVAFTLGVFRPRIYLSEAVWSGAHHDAVLAHEVAHRQARHPLLLAVARLSARVWWYLPLAWEARLECELTAELCADEAAVRAAGRAPLARAMQHALSQRQELQKQERVYTPATAFASRQAKKSLLLARTHALLDKPRALPFIATLALCGGYLSLFFLL